MAFCRQYDEHWAVNLESLPNTETSKLCIISKHGFQAQSILGLLSILRRDHLAQNAINDRP